MSERTEQELVQNSRIFYEAFLPGAVTRLRSQALAQVVGVSDREDALEGLDRTQLVDAVRKYLADWKNAGGAVDALIEEAAERNEFRVQAPSSIFVTPFPLVLRCVTCGALENHDKPRRQHEHILAGVYSRLGGYGNAKATMFCQVKGCGGRMTQVPFVVVHRCGHLAAMSTPPAARGYSRLGLRHNTGMFRQNMFFDLGSNDNVATASVEPCPTCSVHAGQGMSMIQKGTPVSGGDAFFPQTLQFVALSKKPGELVSSVQVEVAQLPEGSLSGRAKDLAEGVAYGLLGRVDSAQLQSRLLQILEAGNVSPAQAEEVRQKLARIEKQIEQLTKAIAGGLDLQESLELARKEQSRLTSQLGASEGVFEDVRNYIPDDAVLLDLVRQRRTLEAVLLRHDVGRQSIQESIENPTGDVVARAAQAQDWAHVRDNFGIDDIAHIPDLKVVLAAVGFTREKREPERDPDQIPLKLNPFEDRLKSSSKGKSMLYALSAQTEALWIRLDPVKVLKWCVQHAGWEQPPAKTLESKAAAQAYLLTQSPALTASPGASIQIAKELGAQLAAPLQLLHTISHALMLTARRHSGYDSQSLTEYLLPMDLSFLVYVTSVQNYTAGGLLTLFQHYVRLWFDDASLHAFNCAFDPICSDVGSSCPGCIQIPRGCETFNAGVSRAYLHGGHVDKQRSLWVSKGYWQLSHDQ